MKNKVMIFGGILVAIVLLAIIGLIIYNKGKIDGYVEGSIQTCPGDRCMDDRGCKTPFEYLVRSSCPFTSICVDNQCAVVCRWDMKETRCDKSADCNCSSFYMGNDVVNCSCIKGLCTAIVSE